jgi:hypothetical protein
MKTEARVAFTREILTSKNKVRFQKLENEGTSTK